MRQCFTLIAFLICLSTTTSAQYDERFKIGVGFGGGYRSAYGWGSEIVTTWNKTFEVGIGFGTTETEGLKYSGGLKYFLTKNKTFDPFLAVHYGRMRGNNYIIAGKKGDLKRGKYYTTKGTSLIPSVGLKYEYSSLSIMLQAGYSLPQRMPEVIFLKGDYVESQQQALENFLDEGLMFSITLIGYLKFDYWE